ncbi:MAG: hypothetical protein EHM58_03745 [Ignavibacteriae bacterium]|nr:MAG: hypothetical protein EHM58_03745 [Ignavibacteriota bacterium]
MQVSEFIFKDKKRFWLLTGSAYILIIALIGVIMRLKFVVTFPLFEFNYILHAHSHTAMLGWVYSALFIAFLYKFLPGTGFKSTAYNRIFWLIQFSVLGMLITFPIKGYWVLSIIFSTLHIIITYWFVYCFVKDVRINKVYDRYPASMMFIYGGLFFLILSTIGPWGLAVITASNIPNKDLYQQAIYFYLHFQYNGWFTFGIIGLILSKIETVKIFIYTSYLKSAFWLLFFANIPAYFLSLLGYPVPDLFVQIGALSAFLQILGVLLLMRIIYTHKTFLTENLPALAKFLLYISVFSLLLKYVLQSVSSAPYFAGIVFSNRDIIIGYIHLVMLGFVTCGLFWWFTDKEFFEIDTVISKTGLITFLTGFFASEILLFMQILVYYNSMPAIPYHLLLFIFSILMLIGLTIFWFKQMQTAKK